MKKVFATILAVIYLSTSMGATIHLHYCMGRLFSWSLVNQENKDCAGCGMPKSNSSSHGAAVKDGCCKDKLTQVKLDKDQQTSESAYSFFNLTAEAVPVNTWSLPDGYVSAFIIGLPTANAPPDPDKVPIFIRNRNFRI